MFLPHTHSHCVHPQGLEVIVLLLLFLYAYFPICKGPFSHFYQQQQQPTGIDFNREG